MICPQCGKEIADGKRFCTECGAKMPEIPAEVTEEVFNGEVSEEPAGDVAPEAYFGTEHTPRASEVTAEPIDEAEVTAEPECEAADEAFFAGEAEPAREDVTQEPAEEAVPAPIPATGTGNNKEHPLVPPATGKYALEKPIGIFRWTCIDILMHLPLVRFVMCIVWSFTGVRPSLKNFARARLLWNVIVMIACVALIILVRFAIVNHGEEVGNLLTYFYGLIRDSLNAVGA